MKGPLNGIRVLAVESFVAGPMASMWLADAGAEVVKIESPRGGDAARSVPPLMEDGAESQSLSFLRSNRNKRSVTLDLKSDEGMQTFVELIKKADIFLENTRPASLTGLGLTYEVLSGHNPRLIYAGVSGFGLPEFNEGDLPYLTAFDIVAQAMSGLLLRPEGAESGPVYPGYPLADIFAASTVQSAIYQALYNRERTGEGAYIDVSMLDGAISLNELAIIMYAKRGELPSPGTHSLGAPFGSYKASDGWVVLGVLGHPVWLRFLAAIERPDLADVPEYASGILRHRNSDTLDPIINSWMSTQTMADVMKKMGAVEVPAAPVWNVDSVVDLEYVKTRRMIVSIDDALWGPTTVAGNPLNSSLMSTEDHAAPPLLGADTAAVLDEWLGRSH